MGEVCGSGLLALSADWTPGFSKSSGFAADDEANPAAVSKAGVDEAAC